jgi:hypothetical protein
VSLLNSGHPSSRQLASKAVFPNEEREMEREWERDQKSLHRVRSKNASARANVSMDHTERRIATENANLPNQRLTF